MTSEAQRIKELERQNKELLCANNMEAIQPVLFRPGEDRTHAEVL